MEAQAGRLPLLAARSDQPPCLDLKITHEPLVADFVELEMGLLGRRQDLPPVLHQPLVVLDAMDEIILDVGPRDAAEVRHPARHRHVAQVALYVDERGPRKQECKQAEIQVVVGHFVHDASRSVLSDLPSEEGIDSVLIAVHRFARAAASSASRQAVMSSGCWTVAGKASMA